MVSPSYGRDALRQLVGASALLILGLAVLFSPVNGQASPPAVADGYTAVQSFDLSQLTLGTGRLYDNQARSLTYLKYVDVNRMMYVFRSNHKLSTNGATTNGGWDAPSFPFRSHVQGHYLTAWAQCYASTKDSTCKSQATTMTAALVACQNNNGAAGFASGYLSGFPESDFTLLEQGKLTNGNVPYYVIHKTLAGLLDVWKNIGDANAKTATLSLASWVDTRTSKLSASTMQSVLNTEFGGMAEVLNDIYFQTGDTKWLTTAARFYHSSVEDPLANNQDNLNGLHGNTQLPKWIGAARNYKATGNTKMLNVAKNAWTIVTNAHAYAIGGITQAEHFHEANGISDHLTTDTAEHCDTYNMMKLTRELYTINPTSTYFDYYERALYNHIVAAQNPSDSHGQISYFTSLNPGVKRGLGPAWGGGTWSTDYSSFWCCQGTGVEVNTKHADSIFFFDSSNVYVNLFHSSTVNWSAKNIQIVQTTTFPITTATTLKVTGSGTFGMKLRIPAWTSGASVTVNGVSQSITMTPGSYATLSRTWASGDTVVLNLPMAFKTIVANDKSSVGVVAYGPVVLAAQNGATTMPTVTLSSLKRTSNTALTFSGTVSGASTNFIAFYEAQQSNVQAYMTLSGSLPSGYTSNPVPTSGGGSGTTTTLITTTAATTSSAPPATTTTTSGGGSTNCAAIYAQCGGIGWTGATCCVSSTCTFSNAYYSQCI